MIKSVTNYNFDEYKTLPAKGWIKPCYICKTITSSFVIKKRKNIFTFNLKFYVCPECIKYKKYKTIFSKDAILESKKYGVLI